MELRESIQEKFGAAAAAYAVSEVHRGGADLDAMLERARLRGSERVLDIGCGPGHTALAFAPHVAEVLAFDLTSQMLAVAAEQAALRGVENLVCQQGDVSQLPFAAGSFDIVTSRLSAHHYADPARTLAEVARVLAPGGRFLFVDVIAPEDPTQDTFLNALELLRDPSHVRDHRASEWLAMFEAAGLAARRIGDFEIPLAFDAWVQRIGTAPDAVTGLRALFDAAPDEARSAFGIRSDYGFTLPSALLEGRRPS
jgi:SAM-dependent methyltransferase